MSQIKLSIAGPDAEEAVKELMALPELEGVWEAVNERTIDVTIETSLDGKSVLAHVEKIYGWYKVVQSSNAVDKVLLTLPNEAHIVLEGVNDIQALELYRQCFALDDTTNVENKLAVLHRMGGLYAQHGETVQALDVYQQALELAESIEEENELPKAAVLHDLAGIYTEQEQVEQAIAMYREAVKINHRRDNMVGKATSLLNLAQLLAYEQQDYGNALGFTQEAVAVFTALELPEAEKAKQILMEIQMAALQSFMTKEQFEQFQEALKAGDTHTVDTLLTSVGWIRTTGNEPDDDPEDPDILPPSPSQPIQLTL